MDTKAFAGRVVLITGGGGTLGAPIARRFAAGGATLALVGKTAESLDRAAATLPNDTAWQTFASDVPDAHRINATITDVISSFGRLDVLVNCAGRVV